MFIDLFQLKLWIFKVFVSEIVFESFGEGTIGNNGLIVKSRVVGLVDASITEVCLRANLRKGGRLDVAATQKQQCPTQPSTNLIESGVLRW